jgi:fatty acid desaturase
MSKPSLFIPVLVCAGMAVTTVIFGYLTWFAFVAAPVLGSMLINYLIAVGTGWATFISFLFTIITLVGAINQHRGIRPIREV